MENTTHLENPVSPIPTIVILVVVMGALLASFFGGAFRGVTFTQAQQDKILPTSALVAAITIPTNTTTPTATASPTRTPPPTSTPLPTVVPTATRDLVALATEHAIIAEYRAVKLDHDEREIDLAWGWVKLSGVVLLMTLAAILILLAVGTAYYRTLRGDFKKPAQNVLQAPENTAQPSIPEIRLLATGETLDDIVGFCQKLDQVGGVYANDMESKFYPSPLSTRDDLRRLVRKMKAIDLLVEVDGGFELSDDGWNMMRRLTNSGKG